MNKLILLIILFLFQLPCVYASTVFEFEKNGFYNDLTINEIKTLKIITEDLNNILPETIKTAILKLNTQLIVMDIIPKNKEKPIIARYEFNLISSPSIIINKRALNKISEMNDLGKLTLAKNKHLVNQDSTITTHHKNYYNYFLGSIIHELGKLFDKSKIRNPKELNEIAQCYSEGDSLSLHTLNGGDFIKPGVNYKTLSNHCKRLISMKNVISSHPLFLNAAGYAERGFVDEVNSFERSNYLALRSLDFSEWSSSEENFAFNLEYFLLDPEFKCRRNILYNVLAYFLKVTPFNSSPCKSANKLFVSPNFYSRSSSRFESISSDRIYEIHYLFAGKGNDSMSKYGHSMLRLIICDSSRIVVDEKCIEDIHKHLVISFRAALTGHSIDVIKGMNGSYPSIEYIFPFNSIIQEYTYGELRWLKSLPLKLSKSEKKSLTTAILESQWAYEGQYKFFTNNCADETLQLLKRGLPFNKTIQNITTSRPDSLYNEIEESELGDKSFLLNESLAISKGYLFSSMRTDFNKSIDILKKYDVLSSNQNLEKYFSLPAIKRNTIILSVLNNNELNRNSDIISALNLLEENILSKYNNFKRSNAFFNFFYQNQMNSQADSNNADSSITMSKNKDKNNQSDIVKDLMIYFKSPSYLTLLNSSSSNEYGYGMLSEIEMEKVISNFNERQKVQPIEKDYQSINKFLSKTFLDSYDMIKENIKILRAKLQSFSQISKIDHEFIK